MRKRLLALVATIAVVVSIPAPALADHEDGYYELPAYDQWTTGDLEVVIVPPNHGQIYNQDEGILGGSDPNELTPFNDYLRAIEASIEEWNRAVEMFGSEKLKENFNPTVYVAGRDVPPQGFYDPDILVVTDENKGPVLGFGLRVSPCIVNNSRMFIESFSYADMYNVNAQEYGHCLGLSHVGSQGGADPTSSQKHPEHDVMNGFYADSVGAADTHLHCVSNLNVSALEYVFTTLRGSMDQATVYTAVDEYASTCEGAGGEIAAPGSVITSPTEGQELERGSFKRITGQANGEVDTVHLALHRKTQAGCSWWVPKKKKFVSGSCDEPKWFKATGSSEWSYRLRMSLPAGEYEVQSRARHVQSGYTESCCAPGRNVVTFTLTS